jgi:hypothetical protein
MALLLVIHVIVCALGRNSGAPISLWSALTSADAVSRVQSSAVSHLH